ncbi:MAG: lamin tail domain-containing protein [Planctomycetes bacterium]|nr:lamin tail domain-containing protein [Planctomycetota bacterium]
MLVSTLLFLAYPLASPQVSASVVINEFRYDDAGADDREFVELYNRTTHAIDLSGWTLASNDPQGPNTAYTIPAGTLLPGCSHYVIGAPTVPNVDLVVGTNDLWENGTETLELLDAQGVLQDAVLYESHRGVFAGAAVEGEGVWANFISDDVRGTSWARARDGYDTDDNRDFHLRESTPGEPNDLPVLLPLHLPFDRANVGDAVSAFGGSFEDVHVIDPLQVGPNAGNGRPFNPNALPFDSSIAGGSGGLAAIAHDPANLGSMHMLLSDVVGDCELEWLVYLDPTPRPFAQLETWSFGVQGTTGSNYDTPDPTGAIGFVINGNTGVSWTFQVNDNAAFLYLVDHNDGGNGPNARTGPVLLATERIVAGQNDGWQRLRLSITGSQVTGEFGGVLGQAGSGVTHLGTLLAPARGGIYIGHQELVTNGVVRPPTFDDMTIVADGQLVASFGNATPTTVGTPALHFPRLPALGRGNWPIELDGLVPFGQTCLFVGTRALTPPLDFASWGGPVGSRVYLEPEALLSFQGDAAGRARQLLMIPCDVALIGLATYWQILDRDPALNVPLPYGHSRAFVTTIEH